MQIVIDIPNEQYENIINHAEDILDESNFIEPRYLYKAILDGTPLPKGHGRLIDADALLRKHPEYDTYPFPSTTIDNAPTIIECGAKMESEE